MQHTLSDAHDNEQPAKYALPKPCMAVRTPRHSFHIRHLHLIRSVDNPSHLQNYCGTGLPMDPRHTLYRTFDELIIDPENMSARTDAEAASAQASSGVTADSIERKLREVLGAVHVEIADLSGTFMFDGLFDFHGYRFWIFCF
jgi:hypothetical protein